VAEFSSGKRAALTTDPEPWRMVLGPWRNVRASRRLPEFEFDPRPEYPARHLTNVENRILAEYREQVEQGIPFADPDSWLANLDAMEAGSDAWRWRDFPEELEHAEKVLRRLAYLHKAAGWEALERAEAADTYRYLPIHRTEAGYPNCATCDGGGCPDCTDPA
jgi:hypothetical protein